MVNLKNRSTQDVQKMYVYYVLEIYDKKRNIKESRTEKRSVCGLHFVYWSMWNNIKTQN
jgi:hypothetical protein